MDLSVVIPCRNAAAQLPVMLDAIAAHPPEGSWEVVVVDDHSTDGTRGVAEARRRDLPVRVVDVAGGGGPGAARNAGVAASSGRLVCFLDHDDEITPGYFTAMRAGLADADLVGGRLDVERLNPRWTAGSRPDSVVVGLFDHFDFLPYAPSCAMGIRREVFEALGGFAEGDGEDVDLSWRAQLRGYRIAAAPDAVLLYRYRPTLGGMVRQAITYGTAQPLLYRRFRRDGMPGRSLREVAGAYAGLVRMTVHARSLEDLASVAYLLGVYLGRVRGSIRYRSAYL
jgi:glycosyltransferase involved in cell wall biosynthesis